MGYLLAGLLTGAGKGLTELAAQRREDALLKLKRQYQQEDIAAEEQRTIASEGRADARAQAKEVRDEAADARTFDREYGGKTGLLQLAQQYKREEGETEFQYKVRLERIRADEDRKTEGVKAGNAEKLARINSQLDRAEDRESQLLKQQIARGEREVVGADENGNIIVMTGDGTLITTKTKLREKKSGGDDDEGEGTIAGARAARGQGPARAASSPAKPAKAPVVDVAQKDIEALWSMLETVPAPAAGGATVRTVTGPGGKKVQIKWTGQRWQPEQVVGG